MNLSPAQISPARQRLQQLDQLLIDTQKLWRPQPYKEQRPGWCEQCPELTEWLLGLTEAQLDELNNDPDSLLQQVGKYLPEIQGLIQLAKLESLPEADYQPPENRFFDGMPGRKREQVEAFSARIGTVDNPILEWCGGKGHLGRLLWRQSKQPVTTLEWNPQLCQSGHQQAQKAGIKQRFEVADVLAEQLPVDISGHHGVALHACGELHRTLERRGIEAQLPAMDIVPCCYANGLVGNYQPRTSGLQLTLQRDDLRLAVTETITAGQREVRLRDREMAWKLGYMELCYQQDNSREYHPIKPINKSWLNLDFAGFCQQLALREQRQLPDMDWGTFEQLGGQRQQEVMRLLLVRNCFRRAIELWLILDLVCDLESNGYRVNYGTFCDRATTPRNIMISARLEAGNGN